MTGTARATAALLLGSTALLPAAATSQSSQQATWQLPSEDRPIAGEFEEGFVVGKADGLSHEMLFGLVDITFDDSGRLLVLEERNRRVSVYRPDGSFAGAFGREGQGPGEFQLPLSIAFTVDREIVVWDLQGHAFLVFGPEGDFRRQASWNAWQPRRPSRGSLRAWPAGGVAYLPTELHEDGDPAANLDRGTILHEPLAAEGSPDTLLDVHHPRRRARTVAGMLTLSSGALFAPHARWDAMSDGRIAVTDGVEYRVRLVEPRSGAASFVERAIPPRPTSEADRERARDLTRRDHERSSGLSRGGGDGDRAADRSRMSERIRAIVADLEFADVIPAVKAVRVDSRDRLWIQRHGSNYYDDGPIDVVTADGSYLGTLPPMPMPDAFGKDGLVAWMERGADVEVERVIVRQAPTQLR